jgi:hypothetical protein
MPADKWLECRKLSTAPIRTASRRRRPTETNDCSLVPKARVKRTQQNRKISPSFFVNPNQIKDSYNRNNK